MLQMAIVLTFGAKKPVVKVGRMAGQFAKPRSAPTETVDGVELPSYRGDIINELAFTPEARAPNPDKMLEAYTAFGGYAELAARFRERWLCRPAPGRCVEPRILRKARTVRRISRWRARVSDALEFMEACGVTSETSHRMKQVSYYTSHEALLLPYEEALTRVGFDHRRDSGTGPRI